jgi:hypothetical protein
MATVGRTSKMIHEIFAAKTTPRKTKIKPFGR